MSLDLSNVAKNPNILTFETELSSGEVVVLRPLKPSDVEILAEFLESLSSQTREFYSCASYDLNEAKKYCEAINRYDKLRFIVISKTTNKMIALFEYSFDIPGGDRKRLESYHEEFDLSRIVRFGPCIADSYQSRGVGSMLLPFIIKIAREFGKKQIFLWGGVLFNNERAIKFYEKIGFRKLGNFNNDRGKESIDMILDLK